MAKDIRDQLSDLGAARTFARAEITRTSTEIRKLAPKALKAGLTKTEIATLAKISRPALDEMLS